MTAMTFQLDLCGIDVDCIIGDRPEERLTPQRLVVDVRLDVTGDADRTDRVEDTVDYAVLTEEIRTALVEARCQMIERAARLVCETCRRHPAVSRATATVTKGGVLPHLQAARVTLSL